LRDDAIAVDEHRHGHAAARATDEPAELELAEEGRVLDLVPIDAMVIERPTRALRPRRNVQHDELGLGHCGPLYVIPARLLRRRAAPARAVCYTVASMSSEWRFYTDLASWWPLVSPPEDYREEAAFIAGLLRRADGTARRVLELGSGGGHNAVHLKAHFELTLVDMSAEMLATSRRLNPELEHVTGDMRTLRLGRLFDAVLIHDAIDYMTSEADLLAAIRTAFEHCRPGAVAVLVPDHIEESYEPGSEHGGSDAPDGRGIRYLEWSSPLEPGATVARTDYVFMVRHDRDRVEVVHETHATGVFSRAVWLRLVAEAGFEAEAVTEVTSEPRAPRTIFVGRR
jgi:SAM-dependent methyltransferase